MDSFDQPFGQNDKLWYCLFVIQNDRTECLYILVVHFHAKQCQCGESDICTNYCEVIYFVVIFLLGTKLFEKSSLWYWFTELSCKFREIFFLQASKVLWCCCAFVLLWLLIGLRIWHYFLNQSNSNVKPIAIWFCNHSSESIFVYNL